MSTPPSELPPPPPAPPGPAHTPTQIAGQQAAPSTAVPHVPMAGGYAPATGKTNSLAIVSLVCGIGSFFAHVIPGFGGFTVALIAVVTGYMARKQIRETGEQGMGMATAGMVIGIVHLVLLGVIILVAFVVIFVLGIALFGVSVHH